MNTLRAAKRLEAAGFAREQAEGLARVICECVESRVATRADLVDMRVDLLKAQALQAVFVVGMIVALVKLM